jgi:hypothetical protein
VQDEVIARSPRDHDLAGLLQRADLADDAGLRLLHLLDPDGSEHVHVLDQAEAGPLRHVGDELVADLVLDALERHGQVLVVDRAQQDLHGAVLELRHVLEHEHPRPHLLRELGAALLEALEDQPLGVAVAVVDDVHERLQATHGGGLVGLEHGREPSLQVGLHLLDDVG